MKHDPAMFDIVDAASRATIMAMIEADIGPFDPAAAFEIADGEPLVDIVRYNPHAGVHALSRMPLAIACDLPVAAGFACPVNAATRAPFPGVLSYLLSEEAKGERKATGRWRENSNRTYAYLLRPMCEALLMEGRPEEYLDDDVMDLVVGSMLEGINRRGQPLSPETIEQTLRAVFRYVDHANGAGMTAITLERDALLGRAYGLSTIYDRDGKRLDRDRLLGARRHMIRPLNKAEVDRLKAALPVTAERWEKDGPSSRPRLTFDTGRRNGFRVAENLGIHVEDVRARTIVDPECEIGFTLKRTKGADHREAVVMGRDVLAWQAYERRERAHWIKAAKDLHGSNWDEPVELFVNGGGAGIHVGQAAQPSSIQRDFREVQVSLRMYEMLPVPQADGSVRELLVVDHAYHDLRHTFAKTMYDVALTLPEHRADPVGFVSWRLGHSHPSTTSRIYLWPDARKVKKVGNAARDAVRTLIDARP